VPQKKHMPEEVVAKLRQVSMSVTQSQSVVEAVRSPAPPSRPSSRSRSGRSPGDAPTLALSQLMSGVPITIFGN
jgi:hypothetical protein